MTMLIESVAYDSLKVTTLHLAEGHSISFQTDDPEWGRQMMRVQINTPDNMYHYMVRNWDVDALVQELIKNHYGAWFWHTNEVPN